MNSVFSVVFRFLTTKVTIVHGECRNNLKFALKPVAFLNVFNS